MAGAIRRRIIVLVATGLNSRERIKPRPKSGAVFVLNAGVARELPDA